MSSSLPRASARAPTPPTGRWKALLVGLSTSLLALGSTAAAEAGVPAYEHIVIVVLENRSADEGGPQRIWDNPAMPYLNSLAKDPKFGARFSNAWASETPYRVIPQGFQAPLSARPSQPNYLYLFSGSHQGVLPEWFTSPGSPLRGRVAVDQDGNRLPATRDDQPAGVANRRVPPNWRPFLTPNLGASLREVGKTFLSFSESLPYPGWDESGDMLPGLDHYRRKHNPAINWIDLGAPNATRDIPAERRRFVLPLEVNLGFEASVDPQGRRWRGFAQDAQGAALGFEHLSHVSLVVPNEMHDAHSAGLDDADHWLRVNIGPYAQWARTNNSLLIVTFDEDGSTDTRQGDPYRWGRHRIATLFHGAGVKPGVYDERIDALNLLATVLAAQGALERFRRDFARHCPESALTCRHELANLRPIVDVFGRGKPLQELAPTRH